MIAFIVGFLGDLIKDKTTDGIAKFVDQKKIERLMYELESKLQTVFLSQYELAPYYDKLDSFLTRAKYFEKWISQCYDSTAECFQSNDVFLEKIAHDFIEIYPQHSPYKIDIVKCINTLFTIVFNSLNDNKHDEITRIIINYLNKQIAYTTQKIDDIKNDTKKIPEILNEIQEIKDQFTTMQSHITENLNKKYSENEYYKEFNNIVDRYQKKSRFYEAIDLYLELINKMLLSNNFSLSDYQEIALEVYVNITLCYTNIGNYVKAQEFSKMGDGLECSDKKKHYYIKAYAIYLRLDNDSLLESKVLLEHALSLDPCYHKAMFLLISIRAALKDGSCDSLICELDTYFETNKLSIGDMSIISEYHQSRGVVYKQFDYYEQAISEFEESIKHGDRDSNKLNIALTLYKWALKDNDFSTRLVCPIIDYSKLIKSINLMQELISDESSTKDTVLVKVIMPSYISACCLLGKYGDIIAITEKYKSDKSFETDYETKRNIAFSRIASGKGLESDFDILDTDDKFYFEIVELLNVNRDYEAQRKIESYLPNAPIDHYERYYNQLLELTIAHSDIAAYKKHRDEAMALGVKIHTLSFLDAIYNELTGNIDTAKRIIDCLDDISKNYQYQNILRFYKRNNFHKEAVQFYRSFHKVLMEKSFYIDDVSSFYGTAIQYLLEHSFEVAYEIYKNLSVDIVDKLTFCKIELIILNEIKDYKGLCKTYSKLYELERHSYDLINLAIVAKGCCDFALAQNVLLDALKLPKLTDEESTKCFVLLSDISLFNGEYDKSYEYITKAADINKQNPYHQVHQSLFARGFRCGHQESLARTIEFKQLHPNVVDWMQSF